MGAYLSTPNIDKHSTDDDNEFVHCGSSQMQGWRTSQEVNGRICDGFVAFAAHRADSDKWHANFSRVPVFALSCRS